MEVSLTRKPCDPEALYELFRAAMERSVNAARSEPWNDERERAQFFGQLVPASVELIALEGWIVGFIDLRASERDCLLHTMVVAPRWQSTGIGSAVLDQLKAKCSRISLSVLKTNARARHFYERAGFREVGSTERHHQMVWDVGRLSPA